MTKKQLPGLNQILTQLMFLRLLLPLLLVWMASIAGVGYFLLESLSHQQKQTVKTMAKVVEQHLEQGVRILDAVGRAAETSATGDVEAFMKSTWEAYKHFDAIYYLDPKDTNIIMVPHDPMYVGLDMSSWSGFENSGTIDGIGVSRPFVSFRTGSPTVYIIRPLQKGGNMIGELNLGIFQEEISNSDETSLDTIFIQDRLGILLAHPDRELVRQQVNMSHLKIFKLGLQGESTQVYQYQGEWMLGNAAPIGRFGWVIIDQVPVMRMLAPYGWVIGATMAITLGIFAALLWNLRRRLQRDVVEPLGELGKTTYALARRDYSNVEGLAVPAVFFELDQLANDFRSMSEAIQANETALRQAQEILEMKVMERTQELYAANEELTAMNEESIEINARLTVFNQELQREVDERKRAEAMLAQAYENLKVMQAQIIQQEKMASLGNLVAGIAHEINTPLGVGVTAVSHLKQLTENFIRLYESDTLKRKDMTAYMEDAKEGLAIIYTNLTRAAELVKSFKQVSVDQSSEARRVFDVKKYLDEVLLSLQPKLKHRQVTLQVECEENVKIDSFPGAFAQIITNLLTNSLLHAYEEDGGGTIKIALQRKGEEVVLTFSDDGKGMDQDTLEKMYDPFFTTKRGIGSGLGLAVLYNIITGQLSGSVKCESKPGQGTTFTLRWPLKSRLQGQAN